MGWIIFFTIITIINFIFAMQKDNEHRFFNAASAVFTTMCLVGAIIEKING